MLCLRFAQALTFTEAIQLQELICLLVKLVVIFHIVVMRIDRNFFHLLKIALQTVDKSQHFSDLQKITELYVI